jgi:hypothetical protein
MLPTAPGSKLDGCEVTVKPAESGSPSLGTLLRRALPTLCVWVACALRAQPEGAASAAALEYFPQEAYVGERVTFVLRAEPGASADALLEGRSIGGATASADGVLELNVALPRGGVLRVVVSGAAFEFRVLPPGGDAPLRLVDGYVYADELPVILLVEHRLPPEIDRRWQIARIVTRLFRDERPRVSSAVLAASPVLVPEELSGLPGGDVWMQPEDVDGIYHTDRLIARVRSAPPADMLVIATDASDIARGMDLERLRIRLEWLLQQAATRYAHVVVALVPERPRWAADRHAAVGLAAASNGAAFLPTPARPDRGEALREALRRLHRAIAF